MEKGTMTASEVRQSFLEFFQKYDHKIVPSVPVVPQDDPTLLFINAGMNQFKDVFLGTGTRSYKRVADSQKCIRVSGKHNDLEEVGHDTYHHTFFEMLGNWSFGDYYKKEAIEWGWELVAKAWGLPKKRLWATVFREDDEAESFWKRVTDIDPSHILRFDEKDNYWEMGETGPCGPCSEIHIDMGEGYCDRSHISGHVCEVNSGCARFIELWNLVFIQFNRDANGKLHSLPEKHVDTGLGLERAVAILQQKKSNYETDLFIPIMHRIAEITGKEWGVEKTLPAFRVISDHIRALTFAITDGAIPSNEGRGYVLRRLLRRAARYGRNLNMHEPFIYKLVSTVIDVMGEAYPEIKERSRHTTLVIKSEEERFNEVLDRGIEIFESIVSDVRKKGQKIIPGVEVFRLYDTYGFPLDLTQLMAKEKDLEIDQKGFDRGLEKQKERAKKAGKFISLDQGEWVNHTDGENSKIIDFEPSYVVEIRKTRKTDDGITLVLSETPFYAESGGQVGDKGEIIGKDFTIQVNDTQKSGDMILHHGKFIKGNRITDPKVEAVPMTEEKLSTARNHTSTHLLHKALKEVLGNHVNQAGSLVAPDRLRFDFTHFEAMTSDQINRVEQIVNSHVRANHIVEKETKSLKQAKSEGATALFGEKYGEEVRVVKIDDYSMELCGGTHLDRTGQIGYFRIVSEEGIAAGVRRIEAVTGEAADQLVREEKEVLNKIATLFRCQRSEVEDRIERLIDERKLLEKQIKQAKKSSTGLDFDAIMKESIQIKDIQLVTSKVDIMDVEELRNLGDHLRNRLKSGVGILAAEMNGKAQLLCVVTDDLIQSRNLKAGDIVKEIARIVDGSGGGKPHLALAGGKDVTKLGDALKQSAQIIKKMIG